MREHFKRDGVARNRQWRVPRGPREVEALVVELGDDVGRIRHVDHTQRHALADREAGDGRLRSSGR